MFVIKRDGNRENVRFDKITNRLQKLIDFEDIDITDNEDEMREKLEKIANGRNTVPQIFINDVSIGGYTDLKALNDSGELDKLLEQ